MQPKDVAIRKRTQIAKANRAMFLWVAAVSAVVGVALVGSIFLIQKLSFNEKVLAEKNKTVSVLNQNNNSVAELEAQVRVLDSSQSLIDSKARPDDQAIQVILDALPQSANSLALGASLQNKLLASVPDLTINSLQVDPVVGVESLTDDNTTSGELTPLASGQSQITFRFTVGGSETALKDVLTRLERSIRTIDITSLSIESQGNNRLLTVQARAFYEPARTVELEDKVVQP
jgi:cell division protein FtsB